MKDDREFEFTPRDYERVRRLVYQHTGITLSDSKGDMVYGRLSRRMRELGITRTSDYCDLVERPGGQELESFRNAVTTNLTSFFRENHHFTFLAKELAKRQQGHSTRRLRIWSAGSSTGEEAYSIAMTLRENIADVDQWDIKIIATDIDSAVLAKGRSGVYTIERIERLDKTRLKRWFRRGKGEQSGMVKVVPEVAKMVEFKPLNLLGEWPSLDPMDFIFCRNVTIYFDNETKVKLFPRFYQALDDDGYMIIGHSENLMGVCKEFKLLGHTVYEKLSTYQRKQQAAANALASAVGG